MAKAQHIHRATQHETYDNEGGLTWTTKPASGLKTTISPKRAWNTQMETANNRSKTIDQAYIMLVSTWISLVTERSGAISNDARPNERQKHVPNNDAKL